MTIIALGLAAWFVAALLTGLFVGRALAWSAQADVLPLGDGNAVDEWLPAVVADCAMEAHPRSVRQPARRRAGSRPDVSGSVRRTSPIGRPSP